MPVVIRQRRMRTPARCTWSFIPPSAPRSRLTPPGPGTRQLDLGPAATHYRWTAPIHERGGGQI